MFAVKTFSFSLLVSCTIGRQPSNRYDVVAYAVAHPLFQWENQFIYTGRYPGGPALINFSV